jgi:hypothetical protein
MSITEPAEALFARLTGFPALAALIATRVFPLAIPQGTVKPCVYYELIDTDAESAMGTDDGLEASYFEITIVADSYSSMTAVKRQIRKALQRYSGTIDGFVIEDCFVEGADEAYAEKTLESIGGVQIKLIHQTS